MGVMGQIYGSRIVVGLASPSQSQLGAIGKMLVGFNQKVYGAFNRSRVDASKKTRDIAQKELDTSRSQLQAFQGKTSGIIMDGVKTSLKQLRSMAGSEGPAMEAKGAITRLSKEMGEAGFKMQPTLMKGVEPWMKNADKMEQMLSNLGKMDKTQQATVVKFVKDRYNTQKRHVENLKEEYELGLITEKQYKKGTDLLQEYKHEYEEINQVVGDNKLVLEDIANTERGLTEDVKDKQKVRDKAEKDYQTVLKETEAGLKNVAAKTKELVQVIKQGFTEAVQQSTVALTAFYYKLNQNTQELIAFERELLNANSVFNITKSELFDTGEVITQFGQKFGMEMQNGATGLYQLASAGLSANDALKVLPETLKLSMAVQGDHNTISKLTAQTIMGFGMSFDDTALLVDKFAHSIQKSLIEYEDLSSAVKFALPFFTATGQSIDQLLGALEILTNRALEAGIAGRGLRQALSEFAEHADDNAAAFRKMGVEILNTDGTMRQLTEIAADYAEKIGPDAAHNTELLTSMIQDLNVRGATAFIHLVQSSDEFTQSVKDLENAGGELDEMVKIQNESLQAQIQILKNNVSAIFLMRDAEYEGTEYMNAFHEAVSKLVEEFQALIVVQTENGYVLSEFGAQLQEIAISGVYLFIDLAKQLLQIIKDFSTEGKINLDILKLYAVPLKIIMDAFNALGPEMQRAVIYMHMLNKLVPLQAIAMMAYASAYALANAAAIKSNAQSAYRLALSVPGAIADALHLWLLRRMTIEEGNLAINQNLTNWGLVKRIATQKVGALWDKITYTWTVMKKLAMGQYSKAVIWATICEYAFLLPLIIIGVLIVGLVYAVYMVTKEFNVFGAMVEWVKGAFVSFGEKLLVIWDDYIFPFIYRMGMEYMAFFGIIGVLLWNMKEAFMESSWGETFMGILRGIAGVIKWLAGIITGVLVAAFEVLYAIVNFVIDALQALVRWDMSALGRAFTNLGGDVIGALTKLWEKFKFWGDGGYIKAMQAGGQSATMNIVGERGPELFIPQQSGQIINTRRTQEILGDIKRRAGGERASSGMANTIIVNEIRANKAVNNKTRMSVDTFAGVV